ncbi:PTS sugar transporter subunit IIA [Naasia aerilata]|uniref:Mannitol-specific phosphotransferase enzyme IIA component n=1 Tax=Naasia aerilata TaxID=1162966 RepID=A0ABN6XPR7_9MICO|nr:PTS sugar transporter subunit IIA [Naasia aerilata]BDZ47009.1 mannitol-specific phosphotransferase enzyme IIA component [Naasia aerilata]
MAGAARGPLTELLGESSIRLGLTADDRFDAVRQCGEALVASGAVTETYVEAMLEREHSVSTYIGEGVAIPHGTLAGKDSVSRSAMVVLGFPDGVDWAGQRAQVCIGIAAPAGGHVALVARLAEILLDPDLAARLRAARRPEEITKLFSADSGGR